MRHGGYIAPSLLYIDGGSKEQHLRDMTWRVWNPMMINHKNRKQPNHHTKMIFFRPAPVKVGGGILSQLDPKVNLWSCAIYQSFQPVLFCFCWSRWIAFSLRQMITTLRSMMCSPGLTLLSQPLALAAHKSSTLFTMISCTQAWTGHWQHQPVTSQA